MSASTGDEIVPALVAAIVAGLVMAMAMMAYAMLRGESPWTNPDLIAAMCMRERVANGRLGIPTLTGFATHMMTSALMGIVAVPFIYGLPAWRTMLASLSYALASYPLVFVTVMTWADPVMVRRTELVPMTVAHAIFGLTLGAVYLGRRRRRDTRVRAA